MLLRCGMCPSYDALRRCRKVLADGMMQRARKAAREPHLLGWENTNIKMTIHVEQRELAPAKMQSGTTSIIYALRNTIPDDLRLKPVLERRVNLDVIMEIKCASSTRRYEIFFVNLDISMKVANRGM